nr:IS630 family transposase [Nocardia miyunensis]
MPQVRDNDGRKLDHTTLEVLRMRAIEQVAAGAHPEEVAVTMGFHKNTVYGWLAKAREGGKDALKLSPQRPLHRAYQQDPDAVARWKAEMFPAIRAEAKKAGATVYFADEAGIRSDYHAGTTWSPAGQTPVVANTGARYSINMLSAVSAQGALRFMLHDGTVNASVFIEFCKRLLEDAPGPVFLIVDGHPSHRANLTKQFIAGTEGRLRLFFLPGYSPELNPDEWVWKNVKADRIGKIGVTSKDDLKTKATGALRRLQKLPALVRGFFRDPHLAYITA